MLNREHREIAERQLAEAEALFDENDPGLQVADAIYSKAAHLRQCAAVHALLSKD